MIKVVILLRRKPGLSREAFSDYWLKQHSELIFRHAETLKIRRYVQSHAALPEAPNPSGGQSEAWDGVAEVWLDGLEVLAESRTSPDMIAAHAILHHDEENFVDLARTQMIVTREHGLIG